MSTTYGYCRISTKKQNIDRQVRNITTIYNDAHIIREIYTGTKFDGRVELDKLLKLVKANDTIVFDSVSRMSRNSNEGCELYESLFYKNINLIFLKEPHINTSVYKDALNNQIDIKLDTGNKPTDELMNSIIDALNKFTLDLAKEQIGNDERRFERVVSELETARQQAQRSKAQAESIKAELSRAKEQNRRGVLRTVSCLIIKLTVLFSVLEK